jgi:protein SCO1/2
MPRKSLFALVTLVIVAVAAGALAARWFLGPATLTQASLEAATLLDPARPLPTFELVDAAGQPFRRNDLEGRWHLLFFGFTNCPDVCPSTLTTLAAVERSLDDLAAERRPVVVFVSVDPERDAPDKVGAYAHFFSDRFRGVTGTESAMQTLTASLGVPVAKVPVEGGGYTVDHGASIFLIDPQARMRALFSPRDGSAAIAQDFRRIAG